MENNQDDDDLISVELDPVTIAHYEARAQAAGRPLEDQLQYELQVDYGLTAPDPGDNDARHRGQLFQRMRQGHILHG